MSEAPAGADPPGAMAGTAPAAMTGPTTAAAPATSPDATTTGSRRPGRTRAATGRAGTSAGTTNRPSASRHEAGGGLGEVGDVGDRPQRAQQRVRDARGVGAAQAPAGLALGHHLAGAGRTAVHVGGGAGGRAGRELAVDVGDDGVERQVTAGDRLGDGPDPAGPRAVAGSADHGADPARSVTGVCPPAPSSAARSARRRSSALRSA